MRLFRRLFIQFLAGFPLPRLIAEKDRQIACLRRELAAEKSLAASEREYHRGLLDSVLMKHYIKPVGEREEEKPMVQEKPLDFEAWAEQDEEAEIEERAWSAANDDLQFKIVSEAASFDPKYKPVLERAEQIRQQMKPPRRERQGFF